mmetsp:Transcript_35007/g.90693  ORF Transcript_35007/g.90693 Transcript_35007/m.90693 type:complete len:409 (-) Transcript_35007:1835-3061(-)
MQTKDAAAEIEQMVSLARSGLVKNQRKAVRALALLAKESEENKLKIVAEGGLQPLEALVQSPNIFIQTHAILTVGFCCENDKNRNRISEEAELLVTLVDLLGSKKMRTLHVLCDAFIKMCASADVRRRVIVCGAARKTAVLLLQDDIELELRGARLLSILAGCEEARVTMVNEGVLKPLWEIVESPLKTVKLKRFAMNTIKELAKDKENHQKLCDHGGMKKIIQLTRFYADDVRVAAAEALVEMARNPGLKKRIVDEGGLHHLLPLLRVRTLACQRAVTDALAVLAEEPSNQIRIVQLGALKPLVALSRCGDAVIELNAVTAIANLAQNGVNRPRMFFTGAFKPLIYYANSMENADLKAKALNVLSGLFQSKEHRVKALVRQAADKFLQLLAKRKQMMQLIGDDDDDD